MNLQKVIGAWLRGAADRIDPPATRIVASFYDGSESFCVIRPVDDVRGKVLDEDLIASIVRRPR